jgi:hypothetical protein
VHNAYIPQRESTSLEKVETQAKVTRPRKRQNYHYPAFVCISWNWNWNIVPMQRTGCEAVILHTIESGPIALLSMVVEELVSSALYQQFETKCSQKWNCAASFPISTSMYLWANNIFPQSVRLCCCIAFADRAWEYINRWEIHECGNWERAVSFLGIFVSNLWYSAIFAVCVRIVSLHKSVTPPYNGEVQKRRPVIYCSSILCGIPPRRIQLPARSRLDANWPFHGRIMPRKGYTAHK